MNINTLNTKQMQLKNGYFSIGTGNEKILIIGSCRAVPYIQYLHDWNDENNNRFTIQFIDPYNWNYDEEDNRIDMFEKILSLEKDEGVLQMLKETNIVIHEWYRNFGMFNFDRGEEKNIYQFGLAPKIDICIPSFNDKFILVADIVAFDMNIRKKVIADYNVTGKLSPQTLEEIYEIRDVNLNKFLEVVRQTPFPEFELSFVNNYKKIRYWHNSNHVSKNYTIEIFLDICNKWLDIPYTDRLINYLNHSPDMYANIYTPLTEYDGGYTWNESVVPLKELL